MLPSPVVEELNDPETVSETSTAGKLPGIAGCYAWMECQRQEEFEGKSHVILVGKVLRLEVVDEMLRSDGSLDIEKAKPLMMTGSKRGMHFSTITGIDRFEPFSAMFPDGRDPLAGKYTEGPS